MPTQIGSKEEFQKLLQSASEIRILRNGDSSKVKLRTKGQLYTFVTTEADIDALTKGTKLPVVEF